MQKSTIFHNYVNDATITLKELGLTVRWGKDFNTFNRIISRHNERYAPSNGFNPKFDNSIKLDGIWLVAFGKSGELVHTQASRRVSILPDLNEHLRLEANAYEPAYLKFDLNNLEVNLSPDASQIKGDAIYHGEAWLKGGPDGIRGGSALFIFSRMMIAKALSIWDVQHVFGLITPFTGIKGLPQRYGYTRCEQGAITFVNQSRLPNDLWLVWMTAAEAKSQLRLSPKYFEELLAPSSENIVNKVA